MYGSPIASNGTGTPGPLTILGLDAVHFFVGELNRVRRFYQTGLEFDEVARSTPESSTRDDMESLVLQAGSARLMFSAPLSSSSRAGRYLRRHPDSVCDLILRVQDVDRAWEVLSARDATCVTDRVEAHTEVGPTRSFTIATPLNDLDITFLERPDGPFLLPGLCGTGMARDKNPLGITGIDHITSNMRMLRPWVDFLRSSLDFEPYWEIAFHTGDIDSSAQKGSGLRSVVMWEPYSGLKLANNEPLRPYFEHSQIAAFCADNRGPGVQHLALCVGDIIGAVTKLRRRHMEFIATPGSYYDMLPGRLEKLGVPSVEQSVAKLRELGVQLDGNEGGYLLQIFMKSAAQYYDDPTAGPFFLELIQREGAKTFGEGNFRALFEAMECEQVSQGSLHSLRPSTLSLKPPRMPSILSLGIPVINEIENGAKSNPIDPSHMTQVGFAFWPSKTLLSAVELELFTMLGDRALTAEQIHTTIELFPYAVHDFLKGLVALGFLERDGDGDNAQYRNTPATSTFLAYLARVV